MLMNIDVYVGISSDVNKLTSIDGVQQISITVNMLICILLILDLITMITLNISINW